MKRDTDLESDGYREEPLPWSSALRCDHCGGSPADARDAFVKVDRGKGTKAVELHVGCLESRRHDRLDLITGRES